MRSTPHSLLIALLHPGNKGKEKSSQREINGLPRLRSPAKRRASTLTSRAALAIARRSSSHRSIRCELPAHRCDSPSVLWTRRRVTRAHAQTKVFSRRRHTVRAGLVFDSPQQTTSPRLRRNQGNTVHRQADQASATDCRRTSTHRVSIRCASPMTRPASPTNLSVARASQTSAQVLFRL